MANADDKLVPATERPLFVIDLGKQTRKKIRKLRKGEGTLMREVGDAIAELSQKGELKAGATTPVVFVVREKQRRRTLWDF